MRTCADCPTVITQKYARWCPDCRWRHRGKPKKYIWTPDRDAFLRKHYDSMIRGRQRKIAAAWGWPRHVIQDRAAALGLTRPTWTSDRKAWTVDEEQKLEAWAGRRLPAWIARQLSRSETSVLVKLKRQRLSRLPDGYSALQVAEAFGVERGTVEHWHKCGWLRTKFAPREGQAYRFNDAELLAFVRAHRTAYDLRKVDQVFFLGLVLPEPIADRNVA